MTLQMDIFSNDDRKSQRILELCELVAGRLWNFCSNPENVDMAISELDNCVCPNICKWVYAHHRDAILNLINQQPAGHE